MWQKGSTFLAIVTPSLKILFVKEGFNICTVRTVCHVTDAKKFNLLCFSVGNLVKKDSRMFYL